MIATAKPKQCPHPQPPELENVDPSTARVFGALGKLMHLNRLVMVKTMAQRGVQPREAFALTFLSQNDGISQRELADSLNLSQPRVSTILRSLEERGAVTRRADEIDHRLTRVFLTPEGATREKEGRAVLADYVRRTIGALPEADRVELDRLLSELADHTLAVLREGSECGSQGEDMKTR